MDVTRGERYPRAEVDLVGGTVEWPGKSGAALMPRSIW